MQPRARRPGAAWAGEPLARPRRRTGHLALPRRANCPSGESHGTMIRKGGRRPRCLLMEGLRHWLANDDTRARAVRVFIELPTPSPSLPTGLSGPSITAAGAYPLRPAPPRRVAT